MTKIGLIGSGSWGKALAHVYANKFEVTTYSKKCDKSSLRQCAYIMMVVPTQNLSQLCEEISEHVSNEAILIICSKGIEISTKKLPTEIVSKYFSNNIAVLSGPNFAGEIINNMPAVASLAMSNFQLAEELARRLRVTNFKLIPTDEVYAVQVFGALKNVLAILAGFARGLGFGENESAALLTQGIKEISAFAQEKSGEDVRCISNPGCIGDLILTCTSSTSRNTKFGVELAKIYQDSNSTESLMTLKETVEGNFTARSLENLDIKLYPLLKFSNYLVTEGIRDKAGSVRKFKQILFE